jgi:hypothetical protein
MPLDGDGNGDDAPKKPHFNARFGPSNQEYYEPTEKARTLVRKLSMLGVPQEKIAMKLGIGHKTLRKHFREDLDEGDVEANAQVAGKLYTNAMNGNVIAQIFWLKAQGGWVDRREVNHNHNIGPTLSHEERLALLEAGPPPDEPPTIDGEAEEPDDFEEDGDEPDADDDEAPDAEAE